MDDGKWITKNGVHILLTNEYMNNMIRNEVNKKKNKQEKKEEDFNKNFYIKDGDFYEEWRKAQPDKKWESKYEWGEEKIINVYDRKNNKSIAYLKYKDVKDFSKTSMTDKINVVNIHVDEKYRRRGIATQLYKELQRRAGNTDIYFGEFSDEGKKLVKSIGKITKVEKGQYNHYWGRINL